MTVVIDTNALISIISARHPHRIIRLAWMRGRLAWALSTEILFEYEEQLVPRIGRARWEEFWALMDAVHQLHGNVQRVTPSFRFRLIADPDDDKFADCAIAAEADWIVTGDAHFEALKSAGHKPQPIAPGEFIARFLTV